MSEFQRAGFRGGLNYYRNFDRNWETTAQLADAQILVPALFLAGEKDLVIGGATKEQVAASMSKRVKDLRDVELYPGAGHWVQQERADEVNKAVIAFLASLPPRNHLLELHTPGLRCWGRSGVRSAMTRVTLGTGESNWFRTFLLPELAWAGEAGDRRIEAISLVSRRRGRGSSSNVDRSFAGKAAAGSYGSIPASQSARRNGWNRSGSGRDPPPQVK
ncbi:MAG: alpha/beta fold hydrolase [Caldimonas sp.]